MSVAFYVISAVTVAGGLAAVLLKNTIQCALALAIALAGMALLFLALDAQFAGFAQILIYIGAVVILVVFAIMLTRESETPTGAVHSKAWLAGLLVTAAVTRSPASHALLCTAPVGVSDSRVSMMAKTTRITTAPM